MTATALTDHSEIPAHAHEADLDACLDFVNTGALDEGVPREDLGTVDATVGFLAGRGLGHEEALRKQAGRRPQAWLDRIHELRSALHEVWDAEVERREAGPAALERINDALRHAPRPELIAGPGGIGVGHRHLDDDPTGEALARLIAPLVEAIADGHSDRFRICANDGCRWVFQDTSRGGRRRWCEMSSCGNRAKVARYRSRHRDKGSAGDAAG